jgi:hypothetical protein
MGSVAGSSFGLARQPLKPRDEALIKDGHFTVEGEGLRLEPAERASDSPPHPRVGGVLSDLAGRGDPKVEGPTSGMGAWLVTCSCGWERECSSEWAARSVSKLHLLHPQLTPMDVAHVTRVEGPDGGADGQQLSLT